MKVLFCASEVAPFAKTGGLADVTGSLPAALGELGLESLVLMPRYRGMKPETVETAPGVHVGFIEHEAFFNRSGLYGHPHGDYHDNFERFAFFSRACLRETMRMGFKPDVVHAHDWHTALLPVLLKTESKRDPVAKGTKSVLTIHNLAYQGIFPRSQYEQLGFDPALFGIDGFEFYGQANLMKAGIVYADAFTTVSPTYAKEIQTQDFGYGLDGVVRANKSRLHGILNGLDTHYWDPAGDGKIPKPFTAADLSGKAAAKAQLEKNCGFEASGAPLVTMVTRLAEQKGLDLVVQAAERMLAMDVRLAILGDGDAAYREAFKRLAARYPKKLAAFLAFDAQSAHLFYAAADFFLMPSLFEPCGLGQMIAMRYGALPVVRYTGGLADTVIDADANAARGNGFAFKDKSPESLLDAVRRALGAYQDAARMDELRTRAMKADFTWKKSAKAYVKLYEGLLNA